jgi:hypothetical protein
VGKLLQAAQGFVNPVFRLKNHSPQKRLNNPGLPGNPKFGREIRPNFRNGAED